MRAGRTKRSSRMSSLSILRRQRRRVCSIPPEPEAIASLSPSGRACSVGIAAGGPSGYDPRHEGRLLDTENGGKRRSWNSGAGRPDVGPSVARVRRDTPGTRLTSSSSTHAPSRRGEGATGTGGAARRTPAGPTPPTTFRTTRAFEGREATSSASSNGPRSYPTGEGRADRRDGSRTWRMTHES